jgi:transposase-like protein
LQIWLRIERCNKALRINGERFYLWRAVDAAGYELDVFLQKRRNKRAATRFLSRLLGSYLGYDKYWNEKLL